MAFLRGRSLRSHPALLVQLGVDHELIVLHGKRGQQFCVLEAREGESNVSAIMYWPLPAESSLCAALAGSSTNAEHKSRLFPEFGPSLPL